MKNYKLTLSILLLFLLTTVTLAQEPKIGDPLPHKNLELTHINGNTYELGELKGENGLLVVFSANKCVAVERWFDRLIAANNVAESKDINVVWINSNQTQRNDGESLDDMRVFAEERNVTYDYLQEDSFLLADALNAQVTPTAFLYDENLKLVYMGVVDDNMMDPSSVKEKYLNDAILQLANGMTIQTPVKMGRGCRIPRS